MAAGNIGAAPNQIAQQAFDMRLAGKVEEAAQHLQAGVAADSTQAILFYELSRTKTFLMDFEGMQGAIERAAALAPDNADYHYFAGMASAYSLINAAHQGREGEIKRFAGGVIDELEAALRCNPDHHEARCMLVQQFSVMAEDMGWDMMRAEEHARILEAKDPVMGAKARANLIPNDRKAGLWEKVIQEHPDRWLAWYEGGTGLIQASMERYDGSAGSVDTTRLGRASACIDKAIGMNPQRFYVLLHLATTFAMAEDWDRAEAITRRYIDMNPPLPLLALAWARLGQIEQRRGNLPAGQELIEKAMAMDPHLWRGFMPPAEELFTRP